MSSRTLEFPQSPLGSVWIKGVTTSDSPLEAKGSIEVPDGSSVHLSVAEGADPSPLAGLTPDSLDILTASGESHDDRVLEFSSHLSGLKQLRCLGARVTDAGMRFIADLESLDRLFLIDTLVTDGGLEHLADMRSLTRLDLSGCAITDEGIRKLANMSWLKMLVLSRTKITDESLRSFDRYEQLSSIMVDGTAITPHGLEALPRLPYLHVWAGDLNSEDEQEQARWRGVRPDLVINGVRHFEVPARSSGTYSQAPRHLGEA